MSSCHSKAARTRIVTTRLTRLKTKELNSIVMGRQIKGYLTRNHPKGKKPPHKGGGEEHPDENITAWDKNKNPAHRVRRGENLT